MAWLSSTASGTSGRPSPSIRSTTPFFPDGRIWLAGLRVEHGHVVPRRHHDDALVAASVGPVRETPAGEVARSFLPADPLVERVPRPERFARRGIDRVRIPPVRRHREQTAVRIKRRRPVVLVPAIHGCVPAPRDLELAEVGRVDLIERRVARAPGVGAPVAPFAGHVAADELRLRARRVWRAYEEHAAEHRAQHECHGQSAPHRCLL